MDMIETLIDHDQEITQLKEEIKKLEEIYSKFPPEFEILKARIDDVLKEAVKLFSTLENYQIKDNMNCDERISALEEMSIEKRLLELEKKVNYFYSDQYVPPRKPFACPVCDGKGIIHTPETMRFDIMMEEKNIGMSACHSCEGKGIVWG